MNIEKHLLLAVLFASCAFVLRAQSNVTLTTEALFSSPNGIHPSAPLILANDGNFYGTTEYGGTGGGYGSVFKITPGGALTTIASFKNRNGAHPVAALVQNIDGNFYGTTSDGGANVFGTVFTVTPAGVLNTLFSFANTNGANPFGALIVDSSGNMYGTTAYGGPYVAQDENGLGYGTIFEITTNGTFTTLYAFTATGDGYYPLTGLAQGSDGNLYGTTAETDTYGDPAYDAGTVFRITRGGNFTNLASFAYTNGTAPYGGLVQGSDGNFYGTTYLGGDANAGTVFKMSPAGVLTLLSSFDNTNGANPYGSLVAAPDGYFYGTTELGGTNNYGTVFRVTPGGTLNYLLSFAYFSSGADPTAALTLFPDGTFYGTTYTGGTPGGGTVFHLVVPAPLAISGVTQSDGRINFSWSAMPGKLYQVLYKTNWDQSNWSALGVPIVAGSSTCSASDSIGPDPSRYYRIQALP